MSDQIDMSLDDIIKKNRGKFSPFRNRGGRVFRGRGASRGSPRTRGTAGMGFGRGRGNNLRQQRPFNNRGKFASTRGAFNARPNNQIFFTTNRINRGGLNVNRSPSKLLISNLDYGVSDSDVKELFAEFGALKKAVVHYDQSGRSLGTADVVFERRFDATRAMNHYNGVPLDGRPMKIQITSSISSVGNSFPDLGQRGTMRTRFSGRGRGISRGRGRGRGGFNRI